MEQTYVFDIIKLDNKELLEQKIYNYTGLFNKIYNHFDEIKEVDFYTQCILEFNVDKSLYDFCITDVKMLKKSHIEHIKEKEEKIIEINNYFTKIKKKRKITPKDRKTKKKLLETKSVLLRNKDKDICFGGKALLREITKLKQKVNKSKKDLKRIDKKLAEFKEKRKRNIFLIGRANEAGNRKIEFHLEENYIIVKFSKNEHIIIDLKGFNSKKRNEIINKINKCIEHNSVALTVRISDKKVYITFDNEIINGYNFDITGYNKALKSNPNMDKSEIIKEFFAEQKQKKLQGKIENRGASMDDNPGEIGFSIFDVDINSGEVTKVLIAKNFILKYYTSNRNLSKHERNKLEYETSMIFKYIFKMCKHYGVSIFGVETLTNITNSIEDKGRYFNRITKNTWNRELHRNLIKVKCGESGIDLVEVNAAYSSFIGNIKYRNYYDSIASAIEIGRRAVL